MPEKPRAKKSKAEGFTLRSENEESTAGVAPEAAIPREAFDDLGDLPHGYDVDTIFLIAQEPHWLFTYWDIDIARHPGGAAYLRYHLADGTLEGEIEVPFETRNWYVSVKNAATDYYVEIGFYRGKTWNLISRSVTVTTPPDGMATSEAFDYATVPFHLSFQRMLDQLENARQSGEDLLAAMARLQQKGDFSAFGAAGVPDLLSDDQRSLLQALLGPGMLAELASGGLSSGDIEAAIRAHLEEQLSSGGASSEFLSSFRRAAGGFSADVLSSETLAGSWEIAALSSWAASAVTSWAASAAGELSSSGAFTSWSAGQTSALAGATSWASSLGGSWAGGFASSWSGASWTGGSQAIFSSWAQAGESSGAFAGLSSWLQGVQSSWAQAALSSWNSAEVSSWFSAAATTSWAGGSETLSSFPGEREFFMHVNAEVIFYGGTDPRAAVTVKGQPITLNPDGTFRYHFVFPNADYEIPIVATSPDGVETRSATLSFTRSTKKIGSVTDTAQPAIGEPMGRRA